MPFRPLILAALLTLPAAAQQGDDPANLMGERVSPPALADTLPINHGAPALEQLLRKLRTRASMMLIVAHPDDEDGGLLTLESRGRGARVAMLTLTRGEGGQNLMTADFNDALGLIRTQELLAEDRYTGVDQFFGTEVDFGFSKTKEESFQKWGHDRVLYDAVRSVRLYRPLVLASVFVGGVTDGHGQHQVSGEITQEVFKAAADPKVFPEMGLPPWAPLRVYARVPFSPVNDKGMYDYATGRWSPPLFHNYVTGTDIHHAPAASVLIHEGEVPNIPAFKGLSYVQFARQGLALQKTQIGSGVRIPPAGPVDIGYTLMASRCSPGPLGTLSLQARASQQTSQTGASAPGACLPSTSAANQQDLFTGIDTSVPGIADLAPHAPPTLRRSLQAIDAELAEAQQQFHSATPELTDKPLREALHTLELCISDMQTARLSSIEKYDLLHELRVKRGQLEAAIRTALNLSLKSTLFVPASQVVVSGQTSVTAAASLESGIPMRFAVGTEGASLNSAGDQLGTNAPLIPVGESRLFAREIKVPQGFSATRPYFGRPNAEQPFYDISIPAFRNAAMTPLPFEALLSAIFKDPATALPYATRLTLDSTVTYGTGPHEGELVLVVPPVSVSLSPSAGIMPLSTTKVLITAEIRSLAQGISPSSSFSAEGTLHLETPRGWTVEPASVPWKSDDPNTPVRRVFTLTPPQLKDGESFLLTAVALWNNKEFQEGYRPVGYPGLTYTNFYTPATFKAVAVDVNTAPNLRIAYLPGTGDDVPQFLPSLGVTPTILTTKDLTLANLKQYDAILLGVRAYSAHPELQGTGSDPLTTYAKAGGTVIAQYNSGGFDPSSAPFPYSLPGDPGHNVVEEEQPVTLLAPESPLLTWPNRITSADFNQWIEERGHGFASDWSPEYTPLLETHDVDQDPQKGGLLVAKVGKGAYIYCALALYRQLPEGVPGAYRLMANLLSYAKNPRR